MRIHLRCVANLVLVLGLAAVIAPALGYSAEGSFERTLKVTGPVDLDVQTGAGDISVTTGPGGSVKVSGTIRAQDEEKVRHLESNPPIEQKGNSIRIGHAEDVGNASISYELVVPPETQLRSMTGSGDQSIDGVAGPVNATTGSGDLAISNIGGDLEAMTGSGDLKLDSVRGSVHARAGSGNVNLKQTAAETRIQTGSGDITVTLPPEGGFDLDAHTGSGQIHTEYPVTVMGSVDPRRLKGKLRGGGQGLDLETGSGNIRIQ